MRPETERKLRAWVPAIAYTGFIFALSSIPGAVHREFPFKVFDKVAHMVEFAGLGLFLTIAFKGSLPGHRHAHVVLCVLAVGLAIGVLDELHQMAVPGRAVEFLDWVADAVGVIAGASVAMMHYKRRAAGRS